MSPDPDADPGALIYSVRPLPRPLPVLIGVAVIVAIDLFIYLTNDGSWFLVLCGTLGAGAVLLAACLSGFLELHRVHEHAVVLGLSWPRRSPPYIVPLASIDPHSVTVHHRANMIARRLGTGGSPTMRMAVYSTRAVSFEGRSWAESSPVFDSADPRSALRRRRMLELRQSAFGKGPLPGGATSVWALGVRDPEPLLRALEVAFERDGRPQPGLADRALAHPVVEPSGQPLGGKP